MAVYVDGPVSMLYLSSMPTVSKLLAATIIPLADGRAIAVGHGQDAKFASIIADAMAFDEEDGFMFQWRLDQGHAVLAVLDEVCPSWVDDDESRTDESVIALISRQWITIASLLGMRLLSSDQYAALLSLASMTGAQREELLSRRVSTYYGGSVKVLTLADATFPALSGSFIEDSGSSLAATVGALDIDHHDSDRGQGSAVLRGKACKGKPATSMIPSPLDVRLAQIAAGSAPTKSEGDSILVAADRLMASGWTA